MESSLREERPALPNLPHLPHVRTDGSTIWINSERRLQIKIGQRDTSRSVLVEMSLDGRELIEPFVEATCSRALLEATKLAAEACLIGMHAPPHVLNASYDLSMSRDIQQLSLSGHDDESRVLMGAIRWDVAGKRRWQGYCDGFHTGKSYKLTAFEALLGCVGYMIEEDMWP